MAEVRCPNCGTSFQISEYSNHPETELKEGIHYLVPETIRNENVTKESKVELRMNALKAAGVNVDKLSELMNGNSTFKDIFDEDDPILESIGKGGFIRNPELFRRWITAQTWHLIKDPYGWTHAVRQRYDLHYVWKQTKNELALLCKLQKKCPNDKRFNFFTLDDLKGIFIDLLNNGWTYSGCDFYIAEVERAVNYNTLYDAVSRMNIHFNRKNKHLPKRWLGCFKGAGAYYTLQNLIRTHGLVLPKCSNMEESLEAVDVVFKDIIGYDSCNRRWDILLSLLTKAVSEANFELKY